MRLLANPSISAIFAVVFLAHHPQSARTADQPQHMAVNTVKESLIVSIDVTIPNNVGFPIVMPSCGKLFDQYLVCFPPAFFEQYDGSAWKKVQDNGADVYGELAMPPLVRIEPGATVVIHAAFPPETYRWKPDQPVRLVIPTWSAEQKSRSAGNSIAYVTASLRPPSVGRTAFLPQP